jgi:hypothetical protein
VVLLQSKRQTPNSLPAKHLPRYPRQNKIPIFCPALTDGSLGDMMYFHTCAFAPSLLAHSSLTGFARNTPTDKSETPLSIDIVEDIRRLNDISVKSKKAGMIILGGGVCKHQIANSMLFVRLSLPSPPPTSTLLFPSHQHSSARPNPHLTDLPSSQTSATALITQSTSTPAKSLTDRIREHGRTKPSVGARSRLTERASKCKPAPPESLGRSSASLG